METIYHAMLYMSYTAAQPTVRHYGGRKGESSEYDPYLEVIRSA